MTEYSVLFDPRLDHNDENDQKIIFTITKLQNQINLRERLFKANEDIYGLRMGDNRNTITAVCNLKNNLNLDLDTVQNVPILQAYGGFPSLKAKKSKARVPFAAIPKESMTVHEQVCYQRRQLDIMMNRKRQLKTFIMLKKKKLPIPAETEKEKLHKEQQLRQIANSTSKMNSKLTTATNLYYSYHKLLDKVAQDVREFPDKLEAVANETKKLVKENTDMESDLKELNSDLARLEKIVTKMMYEIKKSRVREKAVILKLRSHVDPVENPQFFTADEVKFAAAKAANEPVKPMTSMSNLPAIVSPYEKKEMIAMMKILSVYKHIGSKLSAITGISFDEAEKIAQWFKTSKKNGKKIDKYCTKCVNSKNANVQILTDLRQTLDKLRTFEATFVEKKIKSTTKEYTKTDNSVSEIRDMATSKQEQAKVVITACTKWLEKFVNFCPLEVSPADAEIWLCGDMETFGLFIKSMKNISLTANYGIGELLQNSESSDLPQAFKVLEPDVQKELMQAMERAQDGNAVPEDDLLRTLTDPAVCSRFLNEISEEQKFKLMAVMFTTALDNENIKMNASNQRVALRSKEVDDVDEFFEADDTNYVTRAKLKKPRFVQRK